MAYRLEVSKKWSGVRAASISAASGICLVASPVLASETGLGSVTQFFTSSIGALIFYHDGVRTAKPSCATTEQWAIESSTPSGQAMVATLLTAFALGRTVRIDGQGTCSVISNAETVHNIHVQ